MVEGFLSGWFQGYGEVWCAGKSGRRSYPHWLVRTSVMNGLALRAVNLTKRYGPVTAVSDLSLAVRAGEVFGFLGPNGAGKSTTIRTLLGLARPSTGQAWVFDTDAGDVARAHRVLAYVPADVALWPQLTGAEILHLQAS